MRFYAHIDLRSFQQELRSREPSEEPAVLKIPLLPHGKYEHPYYGELDWTDEKFDQMVQNFEGGSAGTHPMLNFDHAPYNPFAQQAPAAGWFMKMEKTPGVGLFAHVELTDIGEEAIRNKRYRYISAEVADEMTRCDGTVINNVLSGAALTNHPFHDNMDGIFGKPKVQAIALSRTGQNVYWTDEKPSEGKGEKMNREKIKAAFEKLPEENRAGFCAGLYGTDPELADELLATLSAPADNADEDEDDAAESTADQGQEDDADENADEETTLSQTDDSDLAKLTKSELVELKRQAAEGVKASKALIDQKAKGVFDRFANHGILPVDAETEKLAKELHIARPKQFESLLERIAKNLSTAGFKKPTDPLGFSGDGGHGEESGDPTEEFVAKIEEFEAEGMAYEEALSAAHNEYPDLYEKYVEANRKFSGTR